MKSKTMIEGLGVPLPTDGPIGPKCFLGRPVLKEEAVRRPATDEVLDQAKTTVMGAATPKPREPPRSVVASLAAIGDVEIREASEPLDAVTDSMIIQPSSPGVGAEEDAPDVTDSMILPSTATQGGAPPPSSTMEVSSGMLLPEGASAAIPDVTGSMILSVEDDAHAQQTTPLKKGIRKYGPGGKVEPPAPPRELSLSVVASLASLQALGDAPPKGEEPQAVDVRGKSDASLVGWLENVAGEPAGETDKKK